MNRRLLLALPALSLWPGWAFGRVVLVVSSSGAQHSEIVAGFKQSYAGSMEEYNLMGLEDEARKLGKNLNGNRPDLLIAVGNLGAKVAREYCADCAVVYAAADNVRGIKLSGPKVAGVSVHPSPAKVIDNLRLALPDRMRIGIIYHPTYSGKELKELETAAARSGLSLEAVPVTQIKEIPQALMNLLPKIDAYLMLDDPGVISADTFPFIFMNCFQKKIPIFATSLDLIQKGAIAGYAPDPEIFGSELAGLTQDALNRKNPGREKSAPAKLFLNLRTAQMWSYSFSNAAKAQAETIQ